MAALALQAPADHTLLATTLTDAVLLPVALVHAGTPTAMGTVREVRAATTTMTARDTDRLPVADLPMTTLLLAAATTTHTVVTTLPPTRT